MVQIIFKPSRGEYRRPVLTIAEEQELFAQIEAGGAGATRARQELVRCNVGLVWAVVNLWRKSSVEADDLAQEGFLGLNRAIDSYEWRRGNKFSTYATWWIRQAVTRATMGKGRTVYIPHNLHEKAQAIRKARAKGCKTLNEIAAGTGLTLEQVRRTLIATQPEISLNRYIGEDGECEMITLIRSREESPQGMLDRGADVELVSKFLSRLTPQQQEVVKLHYGIGCDRAYKLIEIAKMKELSRERIRQIHANAMRKLRNHKYMGEPSYAS